MRHSILLPAALLLLAPTVEAGGTCGAMSGAQQVPLVELYTSEGCSDCPPADKWLSKLAQTEKPDQAAMLAFHVDYWDETGWVDRFSLPLSSQRQKARIAWAKSRALVTPAVMIGEKVMVKWRSDSAVEELLNKTRDQPAPVTLALNSTQAGQQLRVDFQATAPATPNASPAYVWLALYQDGLKTAVRAGENKGRLLQHDRVVRSLHGPWQLGTKPITGEAVVALPEGAQAKELGLVLFAESGANGAGLQALHLPLARCTQ